MVSIKGLYKIRNIWWISFKNSATAVHGLCLVVQLSSIEVNGPGLQYLQWTGVALFLGTKKIK